MSTVFPKHPIRDGEPVAEKDLDENFRPFVEELGAQLNEHNFRRDAFTNDNLYADLVRIYHRRQAPIPRMQINAELGSSLRTHPADGTIDFTWHGTASGSPDSTYKIQGSNPGWQGIDDIRIDIDKVRDTCTYWINASFQVDAAKFSTRNLVPASGKIPEPRKNYWNYLKGFQAALRIDQTVISETITGSLDRRNDVRGEGYNGDVHPFTLDAVVSLPPGDHTFELVFRPVHGREWLSVESSTYYYELWCRELFVLQGV